MRKYIEKCPRCGGRLGFQIWESKDGATSPAQCLDIELAKYGTKNNGCRFVGTAERQSKANREGIVYYWDDENGVEYVHEIFIPEHYLSDNKIKGSN